VELSAVPFRIGSSSKRSPLRAPCLRMASLPSAWSRPR